MKKTTSNQYDAYLYNLYNQECFYQITIVLSETFYCGINLKGQSTKW